MKTLKTAIIGFGTVGQGLAEILEEKSAQLAATEGVAFPVVAISDFKTGSAYDPSGLDLGRALAAVKESGSISSMPAESHGWDALETIKNCGADLVVEATYTDLETGEPATSHVRTALESGCHLATTNKGPVALKARELEQLAASHGVQFLYEGTVMSGTPTISFFKRNLAGCSVRAVEGILNGTTNYMLTEMEAGKAYADVLKTAQELGYAEAVPDADVEGHDALGKVVILSNVVLGVPITPADVSCEGITKITSDQIEEAGKNGKRYKLIGRAEKTKEGVVASVQPIALPLDHPLAGVGGATNAIKFETDLLGDVTVIGPGAGRLETGFSLLADMIEIGRTAS